MNQGCVVAVFWSARSCFHSRPICVFPFSNFWFLVPHLMAVFAFSPTLCFPLGINVHFGVRCILSTTFSNRFLLVGVLWYPLHLNWIASFSALLWNDSYRRRKNDYPKIKCKTADVVSFGVEPDQACISHSSSGKVLSNLTCGIFGTDRILGTFDC